MARINNAITFGSGFNIASIGPIDSRMLVEYERDLTNASNWPSDKAPLYDGITVTVRETGDIWVLKDVNHSGDTESGLGWKKSGNVNIDDEATSSASTGSSEKIVTELGKVGFSVEIVDVLPESGDTHTIYFLEPQESGDTPSGETLEVQESGGTDFYEEYMWIDDRWELIGTTKIDLSDYYTKSKVNELLAEKQDILSAGTNISIDSANTISADGYVFNGDANGGFAEKYKQDSGDVGQIVANIATGLGSHSEGYGTTASGDYGSHAEGNATQATGYVAHAEGYKSTASGFGAHSEAYQTIASGDYSHAEGGRVKRGNNYFYTTASGSKAHAEGEATSAEGDASHTEGAETQALNAGEHAEGVLNLSHKVSNDTRDAGNTRHSVGIGWFYQSTPDTLYRTNAVEIMANGDQYIIGVGGYDGVHIKGENTGITVQTVQEVIREKQDTLKAVTIADDGSALTITLSANTLYTFTTRESDLTISLGVPTPGIVNEYHLTIAIGANVPNVDWPNNWTWFGDGAEPSLSPNKTYEVSILNNIAVYVEI